MPIFRKELYKSEIKQFKIRGDYFNETIEPCTNCRNFTVRQALEYTFNGNQDLIISSGTENVKNCSQITFHVVIDGLDI